MRGWQEIYRDGIAALGADFADVDGDEQDRRLARAAASCAGSSTSTRAKARTAPPEYGGNRDLAGWRAIEFPGDVQPRGYTDDEVSGRA